MLQAPAQKIDVSAIKAWRLSALLSLIIDLVILAGLIALTLTFQWPWWIAVLAAAVIAAEACIRVWVIPSLRWNRFSYEIYEHEIDLMSGMLFRTRTLIPLVKVQHVDTKQGPILRKYHLATVTFSTAAGKHEIPALSEHTADQVREQIARLARLTDEDI